MRSVGDACSDGQREQREVGVAGRKRHDGESWTRRASEVWREQNKKTRGRRKRQKTVKRHERITNGDRDGGVTGMKCSCSQAEPWIDRDRLLSLFWHREWIDSNLLQHQQEAWNHEGNCHCNPYNPRAKKPGPKCLCLRSESRPSRLCSRGALSTVWTS